MPKAIHASEDVGRGGASKGFAGDREVAGHAFDQGTKSRRKRPFQRANCTHGWFR
jgi:hypothetical protein